MSVSHDGRLIASGQKGENADVVIWDYHSKKALFRLSEHDYEVTLLAFSSDDKLLLSCGNTLDGKLFIWNTENGHIVSSLNIIPSVFSEAPRCLIWGGYAKDYKLRNTTDYQFAIAGTNKMTMWQLNPFTGQANSDMINTGTLKRDYTCLTYSKNNEDFLYAGTASGDLVSFKVKSKGLAFTVNACAMGIKTICAVSVDKLIVGGGDGQVILF
jgi:WD40 repeat protein